MHVDVSSTLCQIADSLHAPEIAAALEPADGVQRSAALDVAQRTLAERLPVAQDLITRELAPGVAQLDEHVRQLQAPAANALDGLALIDATAPERILDHVAKHLSPEADVAGLLANLTGPDPVTADIVPFLQQRLGTIRYPGSDIPDRPVIGSVEAGDPEGYSDPEVARSKALEHRTEHPEETAVVVRGESGRLHVLASETPSAAESQPGPPRSFGRRPVNVTVEPVFIPSDQSIKAAATGAGSLQRLEAVPAEHGPANGFIGIDELERAGVVIPSRERRTLEAVEASGAGHVVLDEAKDLITTGTRQLGGIMETRRAIQRIGDITSKPGIETDLEWSVADLARNGPHTLTMQPDESLGGLARPLPDSTMAEAAHWIESNDRLDHRLYGLFVDPAGIPTAARVGGARLSDLFDTAAAQAPSDSHPDLRAIVDRTTGGRATRNADGSWSADSIAPSEADDVFDSLEGQSVSRSDSSQSVFGRFDDDHGIFPVPRGTSLAGSLRIAQSQAVKAGGRVHLVVRIGDEQRPSYGITGLMKKDGSPGGPTFSNDHPWDESGHHMIAGIADAEKTRTIVKT